MTDIKSQYIVHIKVTVVDFAPFRIALVSHLRLNKMADILQAKLPNALLFTESVSIWFNVPLNLSLEAQWIIGWHWFRSWLGVEQPKKKNIWTPSEMYLVQMYIMTMMTVLSSALL